MCSASFSSVGLSVVSEGAWAAKADSAWLTVNLCSTRQMRESRLKRARVDLILAGRPGDLRKDLQDALQLVLVQSHQAGLERYRTTFFFCRTRGSNSRTHARPPALFAGTRPASGDGVSRSLAWGSVIARFRVRIRNRWSQSPL